MSRLGPDQERDFRAELPPVVNLLHLIENEAMEAELSILAVSDADESAPAKAARELYAAIAKIYCWSHAYNAPECNRNHVEWFDEMKERALAQEVR